MARFTRKYAEAVIPLLGERSTFQAAVKRVEDRTVFRKPLVIANLDSRFIVAEQLAEIGVDADIILEPMRRDSAAAVAVATVRAAHEHPDTIVLIMAADHIIADHQSFAEACRSAAHSAARGRIMTFGIAPTFPATSYGYIARGTALDKDGGYKVERFIEKPDADAAAKYIARDICGTEAIFCLHHKSCMPNSAGSRPTSSTRRPPRLPAQASILISYA